MPSLLRLPLYLLMVLLLAGLLLAMELYTGSSRMALGKELESSVGAGGSLLLPWLYKLSPDLTQCIGAMFHARQQWGWSWPAAVLYGFPGSVFVVLMLLGGLGMLVWTQIDKHLRARRTDAATTADDRAADNNGQRRQD